jgi:hypothetical protein
VFRAVLRPYDPGKRPRTLASPAVQEGRAAAGAGHEGSLRMTRRASHSRRSRVRSSRRHCGVERLENRQLLAANLRIDQLLFVDVDNRPIGNPVVGEQLHLRVDWTAYDVPLTETFRLQLSDTTAGRTPITLTSPTYSGAGNGLFSFSTTFEGFYASPGQHVLQIVLDSQDSVTETSESDNRRSINYVPEAPTGLPSRFTQPLAGQQNVDWAITRYTDLDPRLDNGIIPPEIRDYTCDDALLANAFKCGPMTSDQFAGLEFQLANNAAIDRGYAAYAVAQGTVTRRLEGFVIDGIDASDNAGTVVTPIADINGDGRGDLLITAPGGDLVDRNDDNVGEAYVVYGRLNGFPDGFQLADLLPENLGDGSQGFVLRGLEPGDGMGQPAVATGDFNGDGISDFALGAPFADTNGTVAGEVYVVFGRATNFPPVVNLTDLLSVNGGDGSRGFVLRGETSTDRFGFAIANAGDLNGDGLTDLAIGAPNADGAPVPPSLIPLIGSGRVYVVYGQSSDLPADFDVANLQPRGNPPGLPVGANKLSGFYIDGEGFFSSAGSALAGLGDLNGDGAADLAIGATRGGSVGRGSVYIVHGHTSAQELATPFAPVFSLSSLRVAGGGNGTLGYVLDGYEANGQTGTVISALGDVNGNGLPDFAVGVPGGAGEVAGAGSAYIVFGSTAVQPAERNLDFLLPSLGGNGSQGFVLRGATAGDSVGSAIIRAGDLNLDGFTDLAIGSPGLDIQGTNVGGVYIVFGRAASTAFPATVDVRLLGKQGGEAGFLITGPSGGFGIGAQLAAPGNVNNLGADDLLIGVPSALGGTGRVYGVLGSALPFRSVLSLDLVTANDIVEIDHGNGWSSIYSHLEPSSITVRPGDIVALGATLGIAGSRQAGDAKLLYQLERRGSPVETYLDPSAYWLRPLLYQGQTDRSVIDGGITNLDPTLSLDERPSVITRLHPSYQGDIYFWYRLSHLNPNDEYQVIWQRPDGSQIREAYHCLLPKRFPRFANFCDVLDTSPIHMGMFVESINQPWKDYVGQWLVGLIVNNEVRAVGAFDIVSSPIEPEIRMEFGPELVDNTELLNNRFNPIDFGSALKGGTAPTQDFIIENHGSTALHLSNLSLPTGFTLTTPFPSIVNVDSQFRFTLAMDTSVAGEKLGEVVFNTDDSTEPVFRFLVSGEVRGGLPPGTPLIDLTELSTGYQWLQAPQLIDPNAVLTDDDSPNYLNGQLVASVVAGNTADDRLAIRNEGTGGGQIGVFANTVLFSGVPFGTFSGGVGTLPLQVLFNDQATVPAVQALLRNITYANTAANPGFASKQVRFQATDGAGNPGNSATKRIVLGPSSINQFPTISSLVVTPGEVIQPAQITFTANGVLDSDGEVSQVRFYLESNNLPGLQVGVGGDQFIASDTSDVDGWSISLSSSLLPAGAATGYAVAQDNLLADSLPATTTFTVLPPNVPPTIVFLSATPAVVLANQATTLAANGVDDLDGFVKRVDFFRETNGMAGFQSGPGGDLLIGSANPVAKVATFTYSTIGLPEGLYTLYAQARDNGNAGSEPVATNLRVGQPPPVGSVYPLGDLLPPIGNGVAGFVINGDALGSQAGYSVSGAGDVNRDGFDDFLIGSPLASGGTPLRPESGVSYLVFGKSTVFDANFDLGTLDGTRGFKILGATAGDRAGTSVAAAGDVNGDGFGDFLVGAPGFDVPGAPDAGSAYLIFGRGGAFNASFDLAAVNGLNGFRLDGLGGDDLTGFALSSAGDFNGDGYADLLIGARSADPGNPARVDSGAAYLVFGKPAGFPAVINLGSLSLGDGVRIEGVGPAEQTGLSVSWAGDVNGDGLGDILVGAQVGEVGTNAAKGAAYLIFGSVSPLVSPFVVDQLNGANGFAIRGFNNDDLLGFSASAAGDFNADGFGDIIVGVPNADPGSPPRLNAGSAYLIFGSVGPFAPQFDLLSLSGGNGFRIDGIREGDRLGIAVGAAGDINGDGFDDVILGAPQATTGTPPRSETGETYVLFGSPTGSSAIFDLGSIDGRNGFRLEGVAPQDRAGSTVAGAGDINGDGYDDLIVGAPFQNSGSGHVFLGRDFTGSTTHAGTAGGDLLQGSLLIDLIVGKQAADILAGGGGIDVLVGGEGADVLGVGDTLFRRVDGGRGLDTLRFDGAGIVLDLTTLGDSRVAGIEQIDITGVGGNALILNYREVLNLSDDSNQLIVFRNEGDTVDIGPGWSFVDRVSIGDATFMKFTQGSAELLVQAVREGTPWRNPINPLDVDNSGGVTPVTSRDALLVINFINDGILGSNPLPNPPTADFSPPPNGSRFFYDVNGDGFATPIDALLVINQLNQGGSGEGEQSHEQSHEQAQEQTREQVQEAEAEGEWAGVSANGTSSGVSIVVDAAEVVAREIPRQSPRMTSLAPGLSPLLVVSLENDRDGMPTGIGASGGANDSAGDAAWDQLLDDLADDVAQLW